MGQRGRPPKPIGLQELEGKKPKEAAFEVEFPVGIPEPPNWLSPSAKTIWNDLMPSMQFSGILRPTDGHMLAAFCDDQVIEGELRKGIRLGIKLYRNESVKQKKKLPISAAFQFLTSKSGRGALAALREVSTRTMLEAREYGCTPSARTRMALEEYDGVLGRSAGGKLSLVDPIEAKLAG